MKIAVASLAFASACTLAGAAASLDPATKPATASPIPAHELNFSPTFADHPADMTLLNNAKPGAARGAAGAWKFSGTTSLARPATTAGAGVGKLTLRHASEHNAPAVPAAMPHALPKFDASLPAMSLELKTLKPAAK